jgi:hypothetical protein
MSGIATARAMAPKPRSQAKLILFGVFFAVTIFVTYMKNAQFFQPASDIARHFALGMLYLVPHAILCGLALVIGPFQFSNRLRARYLRVHRVLGYIYVTCVVLGAPFAIPLAKKIGTPSLIAASVVQTFGWMFCTGIALYCIRLRNVQQHRRWMIRGYAFATVFTVTRIIIPIPPILRSGPIGVEIVVWTTIAIAAFLPTVFLDWRSIVPVRAGAKAVANSIIA